MEQLFQRFEAIDDVAAYCLVNESGAVSYYMRK
jgi:hypothetical protein